jgi:hypothetical protein
MRFLTLNDEACPKSPGRYIYVPYTYNMYVCIHLCSIYYIIFSYLEWQGMTQKSRKIHLCIINILYVCMYTFMHHILYHIFLPWMTGRVPKVQEHTSMYHNHIICMYVYIYVSYSISYFLTLNDGACPKSPGRYIYVS